MDFCVKCGKKELYQEHLCSVCYKSIYPEILVKGKRHKKPAAGPVQHHANYFEAVIQLRNIVPAVADFVSEELKKNGITVSKMKRHVNGMDIQISSKQFASHLGKMLQHTFGGMVKRSARLFTTDRMSGKAVWRVTVLFKQFPYSVGETFEFKGVSYRVLAVTDEVVARDPEQRVKKLKYKDLERGRLF
jgi:NMD protein affecting ribosome stability and mRNA decay